MRDLILNRCEAFAARPFLIEDRADGRTLSYRDMLAMAAAAARDLEAARLRRGDCVTLALRNSPEMIALLMGALLAGVRVALLGPNYTAEEVLRLDADLRQRALYVDAGNLPPADAAALPVRLPLYSVSRGSFGPAADALPAPAPLGGQPIAPAEVAYVMSSSGSTGKPKRICISSRNMLAELDSMIRAHRLGEDDRHLCVLPLYHASGLYRNVLMPFCQGATVVLCEAFDQRRFWELVERHRIGFVQVVPSIVSLLLNQDLAPGPGLGAHLRYIGSASAPLTPASQEAFERRFGVPIAQAYGLTETSCGITFNDVALATRRPGTPGRPLDVNEIAIMDLEGRPLPAGQTGEVAVRGANVMEGYLGADGEPTSPLRGGWFYTDDHGHIDADGYVFLSGRKSDIVNRGAHKISPLEVEEVLRRHPGVADTMVSGVPHALLGEDLAAFVVRAGTLQAGELLVFLSRHLPSYKVPSEIRFLERIPWSGSGKINRREFAKQVIAAAPAPASPAAPAPAGAVLGMAAVGSALEAKVVRIVAETFNLQPSAVSLDDGVGSIPDWDSMGHIRLMLAIEAAFGVSFTVAESTAVKDVRELVALVSRQLAAPA